MIGPRQLTSWLVISAACLVLGGGTARAQSAVPESQLETFLGLNQGDLTGLDNGPVENGSAIDFTFTTTGAATLTFDYNFLTNEPLLSGLNRLNPFAFITAPVLTDFADTFSPLVPWQTPFAMQTGYNSYQVSFDSAGTYMVGIGVANVTNNVYSSALLLDNFTSTDGTITNGSFESGNFNGFMTMGNTSIVTSSFGSGPTDGTYEALLSTATVPEPSSIVLMVLGGFGALVVSKRLGSRSKKDESISKSES